MINYDTLLSSYDDKLTLMQWLKKVEAALKDASAVSFNVNKRGDATLTFSVVFEDGSELETAPIVLQQGESVTAAHIDAGHLILTLSNGDELDAGNLGAVSGMFINSSQHLIVTYQDGTTQDLGAIFTGNVVINGNFEVTGRAKLPTIDGDANGRVTINADVIINDSDLTLTDGALSTPVITSAGAQIEAQKPVVEVMNGYTLGWISSNQPLYVGAVKNGNKLTIVVFGSYLGTGTGLTDILCDLYIPLGIYNKLYPYNIGALNNVLDQKVIPFFSDLDAKVDIYGRVEKNANAQAIRFIIRNTSSLQNGVTYFYRYEVTFLLSENLGA